MRQNFKKIYRHKVLMIGPYPPPYGGIAIVIKNLINQCMISREFDVKLYRIGREDETTPFLIQLILDSYSIIRFVLTWRFKDVDIIHIHTASYWSFIRSVPYILIYKYLSKGETILHIHGAEFHIFYENSPAILKKLIIFALESSNDVIVTSPSWIDVIKNLCVNCNSIDSVPNGYDPKKFCLSSKEDARESLGLSERKKILVSIGSLEAYKGHKYLIKSMKEIIKYEKDIVVYIIGAGSMRDYLDNLIQESSLGDYVILAGGNKPASEIPLWISASDLFVLPSLAEGNPTVMFECLGCGTPFIGTRVGGIPDIITSDDYGLLVAPADPLDLSKKILIALEKEWDHELIRTYAEQFTWERITEKTINIYKKLIDKRR